jgi:hypothetical protein
MGKIIVFESRFISSIHFLDAKIRDMQDNNSSLLDSASMQELNDSAFVSFGGKLELRDRDSFLKKWTNSDESLASNESVYGNSEFFSSPLIKQNRRLIEHSRNLRQILFYDPHGIAETLLNSSQNESQTHSVDFVDTKSFDFEMGSKTLLKFYNFNSETSKEFSFSGLHKNIEFVSTLKKSEDLIQLCKHYDFSYITLELDSDTLPLLFLDILLNTINPEFIQERNRQRLELTLIFRRNGVKSRIGPKKVSQICSGQYQGAAW